MPKLLIETAWPITIDYTKTLYEMIDLTGVDWFNPEIMPARFIICGEGRKGRDLELIHFNYGISYQDAGWKIKRLGRRPAKIEELLAFAAAYPHLQSKFPIIGLGSICRINGHEQSPFLQGWKNERDIRLSRIDVVWQASFRFATVRF